MAVDSPINQEVTSIKAKAASPDVSSALQEAQADWGKHASNAADLQQFSQKLKDSGVLPALALEYGRETMAAAHLDSLDLQGVQGLQQAAQSKHDDFSSMLYGQLANDWDRNKAPDSGKLTAAQIDVDMRAAVSGQNPQPDAGVQQPAGQPPAPAEAAFTRPIGAGEGPYQPIAATHPDWNPHQVLDAAHKVKAALGPNHVYRQGEQLRLNDDGTVTSRQTERHNPGNYDDTTMNAGKKVAERKGDANGNWVDTTFGDDGKPTGSVEHKQDASGSFTETTTDATGKKTAERKGDGKGNWTNTTFGADGNASGTTEHVQNTDGSYTETNKDATGKVSSTVEHKINADHTTDDTTKDGSGNTTQTVHTNADKSTVTTAFDAAHPGNFTETHAGPDGKPTGTAEFTQNATDNSTDRVEKSADGTVTKTVHTNADHSTITTVPDPAHPGVSIETRAGADGTVTGTAQITTNADQSTDRVEKAADGTTTTKTVYTNPDHSTVTVEYVNGQPSKETDVAADQSHTDKTFNPSANIKFIAVSYGPEGESVGNEQVNNDGSSHKWSVDGHGNSTTVDVEANRNSTTKITDGSGKAVSTVIVTHENGKIITVTQVPGQADQRTEAPDDSAPTGQPNPAPAANS